MTQSPRKRTLFLAAVDASAIAEAVIDQAVTITRGVEGGELHVVHVVDTIPLAAATVGGSPFGIPSAAALMKTSREHLERLLHRAEQQGVKATGHLVTGNPQTAILQLTAELEADLLLSGTHDPGRIERLVLGSVAETLVRKAPCPVLVVRAKRSDSPEVPEILPPCPDCVAVRQATGGEKIWCERHSERHIRAHTFYEYPQGFGSGSWTFQS
jgi:nucleotide-binding universal stress UspA family protein